PKDRHNNYPYSRWAPSLLLVRLVSGLGVISFHSPLEDVVVLIVFINPASVSKSK
ncbi:hypothetical protein BX616_007395, partial [Lobosporangium transversale]